MVVERCTGGFEDWVRLREALWPHAEERDLRSEAGAILGRPDDAVAFIVHGERAAAVAFTEATMRRDYVNGCSTSPVEGLYVDPDWQKRGIARILVMLWRTGL
jgi:aminoglycoside 6'-N-acetyltransferase I